MKLSLLSELKVCELSELGTAFRPVKPKYFNMDKMDIPDESLHGLKQYVKSKSLPNEKLSHQIDAAGLQGMQTGVLGAIPDIRKRKFMGGSPV